MEYIYVYAKEGVANYCQGQKVTPNYKKPARVRKNRDVREKLEAGFFIETTIETTTKEVKEEKKDNNKGNNKEKSKKGVK